MGGYVFVIIWKCMLSILHAKEVIFTLLSSVFLTFIPVYILYFASIFLNILYSYRDQFSMMAETVSRERHDLQVREKAQRKVGWISFLITIRRKFLGHVHHDTDVSKITVHIQLFDLCFNLVCTLPMRTGCVCSHVLMIRMVSRSRRQLTGTTAYMQFSYRMSYWSLVLF